MSLSREENGLASTYFSQAVGLQITPSAQIVGAHTALSIGVFRCGVYVCVCLWFRYVHIQFDVYISGILTEM